MRKSRVVITGMGLVTGLGNDVVSNWERALLCESAVDVLDMEGNSTFQLRGSKVKNIDDKISKEKQAKMMRIPVKFAVAAAQESLKESKLSLQEINPERIGIVVGTGSPTIESELLFSALDTSFDVHSNRLDTRLFAKYGINNINPFFLLIHLPNAAVYFLSHLYNAKGINNNFIGEEDASLHAIKSAYEYITNDLCDVCICCGYDSLTNLHAVLKYDRAGILTRYYRNRPNMTTGPFDFDRNGFAISEGAGVLVLENREHASCRSASIYAEILSCSAFSWIGNRRSLEKSLFDTFERAFMDGGCTPQDIDYICYHGEVAQRSNKSEMRVIQKVFGSRYKELPVGSIESLTGYMGAASGMAETIFSVLSVKNEKIPPMANYMPLDSECDLNFVVQRPLHQKIQIAATIIMGNNQVGVVLIKKCT